jgi:hypothetical protein
MQTTVAPGKQHVALGYAEEIGAGQIVENGVKGGTGDSELALQQFWRKTSQPLRLTLERHR